MFELGIAVQRFERVDSQTVLLDVLCDLHYADSVKHFPFATQVDFAQESDAHDPSREVLALSQALSQLSDFLAREVGVIQVDSSQDP